MPRTQAATAETRTPVPANGHGLKPARPYPTKTIGCRPETQAALDELRGRLATAGQGMHSETEVIAAAVRRWLAEAVRDPSALRWGGGGGRGGDVGARV